MPLEGTCNHCGQTVRPIHHENEHVYFITCPLWRHVDNDQCDEVLVDINNVAYDKDPEDLPLEQQ